jgi:hypothetical protein|tara:strand:+ start:199 stop:465 length:267 start_codon:yes stop_codon:yes gene_type:complete
MRLTNNTYGIRNINEKITGTVKSIHFYKFQTVNDAIKDYAQKFDNWRDLYFKDISLTSAKAKTFTDEVNKAVTDNKKLDKDTLYSKVK